MKKKTLALLLACILAVGVAAGGTIAWLNDRTETVTNTFTVGDINIDLTETTGNDYSFVPGQTLKKDPQVKVTANSEPCYLFVRVTEKNNNRTDDDLSGSIIQWTEDAGEGWSEYTPSVRQTDTRYFYQEVDKKVEDQVFEVLACRHAGEKDHEDCGGCVDMNPAITKSMVEAIKTSKPALSFTAAAVQSKNLPAPNSEKGEGKPVDVAFNLISWPAV